MPNVKSYDVVVAGGGVAGVAAAVAASRRGAHVALIEKQCLLGGLATSGMIYIYLPLCDGYGHETASGLALEMMKRSVEYGPFTTPPGWAGVTEGYSGIVGKRFRCCFSPGGFELSLDKMLEEAGVDVWYDSLVCGVRMERRRVKAVEVENMSGRVAVAGKVFVDASGSCVVARLAGAPVLSANNSQTIWALDYQQGVKARSGYELGDNLDMHYISSLPPEELPESYDKPNYREPSGKDVSRYALATRRELREEYLQAYASGKFDRTTLFALKLPIMPQFRRIWCLDGQTTLQPGEYGVRFEDSIGLVADWRRSGEVWEVPYTSLLPQKIEGVIAAGRCTAAAGDAWEVTRVIPAAAVTGEAAGVAAALSVKRRVVPSALPVKALQNALGVNGIPLHLPDVGLAYK